MNELNENKKSETKSQTKSETKSQSKAPAPKIPTPSTAENLPSQPSQAPLPDHPDLQSSKSIENIPTEKSKDIDKEKIKEAFAPDLSDKKTEVEKDLNPVLNGEKSQEEKDLDLLKNSTETKTDDLGILDTKPGLVQQQESRNDEQQDDKPNYAESFHDQLVFSKSLDPNERKHFQIIVKQQKESNGSLRKQVQALVAYIMTLPETEDSKALLESLSTL